MYFRVCFEWVRESKLLQISTMKNLIKNNYTASFTDNSFDALRSGEGLYTISVIEPVAISTGLRLASFEEIPFL